MNALRIGLVAAVMALGVIQARDAQAVTLQYAFSGSFDFADTAVNEFGPPLSDYLPQLAGITSFTGSFGYQYNLDQVLEPNMAVVGGTTLHIDSLFGGTYPLGRTSPAPYQGIIVGSASSGFLSFEVANLGEPGAPEVSFQPGVIIENMQVLAYYDMLPATVSEIDLTSPTFTQLQLRIRLKAPNGDGGFDFPVNSFPITSITAVPEPGTLALAAGALALGIVALVRRKR